MGTVINTVVHRNNFPELPRLAELIYELNPDNWRFLLLDQMGRGKELSDLLLTPDELRGFIVFLIKHRDLNAQREKGTEIEVELGCAGWPGLDLALHIASFSIPRCIGGLVQLGVLHDGKIGACNNISCDVNIQGDWRKGEKIIDIWEKRFRLHRRSSPLIEGLRKEGGSCNGCNEWDYCHGGPLHRLELKDGKLSQFYCLMRKLHGDEGQAPNSVKRSARVCVR
jgi:radical SAM protein with 4Fe4S-binding SPASM domain